MSALGIEDMTDINAVDLRLKDVRGFQKNPKRKETKKKTGTPRANTELVDKHEGPTIEQLWSQVEI